MKAKVIEIQVGGGRIFKTLLEACLEYLDCQRTKMHFFIELPDGSRKGITIRDEDEETVAYGDFEGLPSALDYAREIEEGLKKEGKNG